jgi:hypothetical protein
MIISQIIGGLGNQMFQYAAGRALSLEHNQSLLLDTSGFAGYNLHQGFELNRIFNCSTEIATNADVRNILGWQFLSGIRRIVARSSMAVFRHNGLIIEPHFHYWPEIKNIPQNSYLAGYWQSEKYFKTHTSEIRSDFTFKIPFSDRNAGFAQQITKINAVSLHVRRGDYINNVKTNATHGLCSLSYYQAAIHYVSGQITNPFFLIFSDDITWVKDNLTIDFPHQYIDYNHGLDSYNDMHLMSLCKHNIIANSSFSWWGAWLNSNVEKIVVAPQKWFANNNNTKDLLPQGWIRL